VTFPSSVPIGERLIFARKLSAFLFLLLAVAPRTEARQQFRFAFVSDTHVGSTTGSEDLSRTVHDINATDGFAFIIVSGDITEMGTNPDLRLAKTILDSLKRPCYVIPGNHDTKWSSSGCTKFKQLWGDDKFTFVYSGIRFIGCSSGPNMRMGDGHVPPEDIRWLDSVLTSMKDRTQRIIFINHYPLDSGLDNWYEITDRLREYNTIAVLCGHGHANKPYLFEGIPATMGRSNLRAAGPIGGYNIVDVRNDTMYFLEKIPGVETRPAWRKIPIEPHHYGSDTMNYPRPNYSLNKQYPEVSEKWIVETGFSNGSTPAIWNDRAIVGNSGGAVEAYSLFDGSILWRFQTGASVYSSPAISEGKSVFGSSDGSVYCVDSKTGTLTWRIRASEAVVASPTIHDGVVYIGSSDGKFRAIELKSGALRWTFEGVDGFVESKPLVYDQQVVFGAWDTYLYALHLDSGTLAWKWSNGKPNRLLSPAACVPVAANGAIFIVAPDRFMSALDEKTGRTVWRVGNHQVREMIGISEDSSRVYVRLMNDSLLAFESASAMPKLRWTADCKYGYDIDPSMPVEKEGRVMFGTKNGLIYNLDAATGKIRWLHKLGNTIVNTVLPLSAHRVIVTTMDGKIALIEEKK
jgi:outer membrane protein assembly factor BamB/Icc-related predicted phosphoesterase